MPQPEPVRDLQENTLQSNMTESHTQPDKKLFVKKHQPNTELPPVDVALEETTSEDLKRQFEAKGKIINLKGFLTHHGNHVDECTGMAAILFSEEGKKRFSFVEGGYGIYFPNDKGLPERYLGYNGFFDALEDGYILIGIGNGPYDEHGKRNTGKSCASLIMNNLGIMENEESKYLFNRILRYVDYEDTNGSNFRELFKDPTKADLFSFGLFADNIKAGNFAAQGNIAKLTGVVNGALQFLQNEIESQRLQQQAKALYKDAKKVTYDLPVEKQNDRAIVVHIVYTDNEAVTKHAVKVFKTAEKQRLGILLSINSKGQFYMRPFNGVTLDETVKILRIKIAQKNNQPVTWQELNRDGSLPSSTELHVHKNEQGVIVGVMNGSLTHPEVKGLFGTVLTESDIMFAIRTGLDTKRFAREHASACSAGTCPKKASGSHCPFYVFGLQRCHDIRKKMTSSSTIAEHVKTNQQGNRKQENTGGRKPVADKQYHQKKGAQPKKS